jgi:hypothetical protein
MKSIAQLNGRALSGSKCWYAVSIDRESFDKVYRWVFDTYSVHAYRGGTWLCWDDISEIWFEHEKDAMFCVMKWT